MAAWKCQAAAAATQASFVVGSVILKNALKYVDEEKGEAFSPIVYALAREAVAGPILLLLSWAIAGALRWRFSGGGCWERRLAGQFMGQCCIAAVPATTPLVRLARCGSLRACCKALPQSPGAPRPNSQLPPPNAAPAGPMRPKQADLWRVALMGGAMFLSQLLYILGIELSGVAIATCMQPAIPVSRERDGEWQGGIPACL